MTILPIVFIELVEFLSLLVCRFDLAGLSLDAPEDEAGIKQASENSEFL